MMQEGAVSHFNISEAERESLLAARVRLMKLPPERIINAQTAPAAPLKGLFDALDGDAATVREAMLAFIKGVNELCDGVLRKQGRANASAVEAAAHGFEALADRLELRINDPVTWLRVLRDSRAAERQLDIPAIDGAVRARATARLTRDFDTADRLHRELLALGVVVVDDGDGSDWTLTADQGPLTGGAGR
jgi:cysteinyl-tRNA synthetase